MQKGGSSVAIGRCQNGSREMSHMQPDKTELVLHVHTDSS